MSATVYVQQISSLITQEQISELFSCCGVIQKCDLSQAVDGKKSAVITFSDAGQAAAAVALSGTVLGDCAFTVSGTPPSANVTPASVAPTPQLPQTAADLLKAQTGYAIPGSSAAPAPTQEALLQAQMKREEEISRTIYVGNLRPEITEEQLSEFLSKCGEVVCVKHCNNTVGDGAEKVRYSFVEFKTREGALTAMNMGGTPFAGRPLKVGKALNPIIKNAKTMAKKAEGKKLSMTSDLMKRVLMHAARIGKKVEGSGDEEDDEKRDRSRSRDRRRRRSRDRDRDRRRRDEGSPEERERRRRGRSRSGSRSRRRRR